MPRLFTAIEIPETVGTALAMLRGGLPGARWIDTENFHVTLRFIGDVDRRTAVDIAAALAREKRSAFPIRLAGLDVFGGNKPHSVHVRVEKGADLVSLQASHERICRQIGLRPETRKFMPHVTLARLRNARHADIARYMTLRAGFSLPPFDVNRVVLFSSRDSVGGGPYIIEQAVQLASGDGNPTPAKGGTTANMRRNGKQIEGRWHDQTGQG